jgi:hypothetical protein
MGMTIIEGTKVLEEWLRENYPTPYPVEVRWSSKIAADRNEPSSVRRRGYFGECYWVEGKTIIRLSKLRLRQVSFVVDTLQHEWAHAMTMPNSRVEKALESRGKNHEHPDEFWLALGRIYRAWWDDPKSPGYKLIR